MHAEKEEADAAAFGENLEGILSARELAHRNLAQHLEGFIGLPEERLRNYEGKHTAVDTAHAVAVIKARGLLEDHLIKGVEWTKSIQALSRCLTYDPAAPRPTPAAVAPPPSEPVALEAPLTEAAFFAQITPGTAPF